VLQQHRDQKVQLFVVWEPVLATDWGAPSTAIMRRVSDARVQQYWDKGRLLSKAIGEHDKDSAVWDWVGVYSADAAWEGAPPKPLFADGPVIDVVPAFTKALESAYPAN
jgi:hypothetical protein